MEEELERLEQELREVCESGLEYLPEYGYSSKEEVIDDIQKDIRRIRDEMTSNESGYTEEELEHERTRLCQSLGISRYC